MSKSLSSHSGCLLTLVENGKEHKTKEKEEKLETQAKGRRQGRSNIFFMRVHTFIRVHVRTTKKALSLGILDA